jgi:hypothetical protein
LAIVIAAAIALRLGTSIRDKSFVWDEQYITGPILDLLMHGWSFHTAIDFHETKGPALIWTYALLAEFVGAELNSLRLISVMFFCAGAVPLLVIARRCGAQGLTLAAIALLYLLIPYHAVLGQLLMSEPSFVFGGLCLMLVFMWGFGASTATGGQHRIAGPVMFGIILAILLHNRLHAAAFAAAAVLVAFERDRWRSWPWWLACALAGLARLPLWIRWGGPVSPEFQHMHQLGLRLEALTYLAAALVPYTTLFIWPALSRPDIRRRWWLIALGVSVGFALTLIAPARLDQELTVRLNGSEYTVPVYQGVIATFIRSRTDSQALQSMLVGVLAMIGLGSLGALAALALGKPFDDHRSIVLRLQFWTWLTGWAMYGLTAGYVFDRFLTSWAILMPLTWVLALPRWLAWLQSIALAIMLVMTARTYLL